MEESKVSESHLTSAAAFVEGGIQDACDDACSICLEEFNESDPSTLTSCKHEFHLQCILEWCQRSSQCPMCWQPISLKDPGSQELLDAVEQERNMRMNPPRNTTIFHHPTLGDFELQHLPVSASDSELEERIIQHLAAAAAMGRARQIARREGQRTRSSAQGRPQFLVFSTQPGPPGAGATSSPSTQRDNGPAPAVMISGSSSPFLTVGEDTAQLARQPSTFQADLSPPPSGSSSTNHMGMSSSNRRSPVQTSPNDQDRAGPSDLQSFSESLKSRLSALSMRYKDSITKSTRGWKERLFARNSSTPDPGTETRREVDPGIATVSRLMDHLEVTSGSSRASVSSNIEDGQHPDPGHTVEMGGNPTLRQDDVGSPCTASSASR